MSLLGKKQPRVLVIHSDYPFPPRGGDSLAVKNIMKAIQSFKHCRIDLVCFGDEKLISRESVENFRSFLIPKPSRVRFLQLVLRLLQGKSYVFYRFYSRGMRGLISKLLRENTYDAIYIEHAYMALSLDLSDVNFSQSSPMLSVDVLEFKVWESRLANSRLPGLLKTLINFLNRKTELEIIKKFPFIISYGYEEVSLLKSLLPSANIHHFPVPMATKDYARTQNTFQSLPSQKLKLLFLGNLAWFPNFDAVEWLLDDLMPSLQKYADRLRIEIIGKNLPERVSAKLKKLDSSMVRWMGYLEQIDSAFDGNTILFVPLRIGGGTRLKILEAMCRGVPVLSTSAGREGVLCKNDAIMTFQDGESLQAHIDRIFADPSLLQKISKNALDYIQTEHSYEKAVHRIDEIFQSGRM